MDTQITLSPELKARIEREAAARGLSLPDLVRELLERGIQCAAVADPLFADIAVFRDAAPADLAENHDEYLYGERP